MSNLERGEIARRLLATFDWSAARNYRGHSKHDALNSPFLAACARDSKVLRLAVTQAVMRFPFNVRSLLGVPVARNPKGIGLFAHACLDVAAVLRADPDLMPGESADTWIRRAETLLAWLAHHASPNAPAGDSLLARYEDDGDPKPEPSGGPLLAGCGWGYHYPWQDAGFFQPRHFPNRVVTSWIGFAFLRAHELTGDDRHLAMCREIAAFLTLNPRPLVDRLTQLCLSYVPLDEIEVAVMDVSALVAAFLARYSVRLAGDDPAAAVARATARRLIEFVTDKQTDYGAWFYTWPKGDSHIKHDNYHTGIILDCIADAIDDLDEPRWEPAYRRGLEYYRTALFTPAGAPRWMNDRTHPHDIHGAAAGVLAFTRAAMRGGGPMAAGDLAMADRILAWTFNHLWNPDGYFYYQKTRWFTKRFCLMRWCNAWMCRAMAQRLRLAAGPAGPERR